MLDFIYRLLGKESTSSKDVAKKRIQHVLIFDRTSISEEIINRIREDISKVISSYMEIDEKDLKVEISKDNDKVALVTNIPIIKMKRNYSPK